ncbi:hypothetical protein PG985_011902 [Apiospora marii]|uniref:uncharacterized protein n=1 Tax=Apiospora marii TaxID=335849 RepID=UPI00312F060D
MHFTKIFLLVTSTFVLSFPGPVDSAVSSRDTATTELGKIVARAFTCSIKDKAQCTKCPKAKLKKVKCPKGSKCKRASDSHSGEQYEDVQFLEARVDPVPMDGISWGEWGPGKELETGGLSACSVMVVYDQNKWVMGHIPPARARGTTLDQTGAEVIDDYKSRMTKRFDELHMQNPESYLLVSELLSSEKQNSLRQWFQSHNLHPTVRPYGHQDVLPGSGNFVLSRQARPWPPTVSFIIDETQKSYTVPGSATSYTFRFACENDARGSRGNGDMWNTTSLDGCVTKCAEHNHDESDTSCGGVVWNGNLTSALGRGGNCYLKMGTVSVFRCNGCVAVAATLV